MEEEKTAATETCLKKVMKKENGNNKNGEDEEYMADGNEHSDSEEEDEESDHLDMDLEEEERLEEMERINFDFEAFPPAEEDLEGIEGFLEQVFLRTDVGFAEMAKEIVAQSPFGCVYRLAEEEEEAQSHPYGLLSIVTLNGKEKFQSAVSEFLLQRAKKYAINNVSKQFEKLLAPEQPSSNGHRIGLLINERFLNLSVQISRPAFSSLKEDLNSLPSKDRFSHILAIIKVRVNKDQQQMTSNDSEGSPQTSGQQNANDGQRRRRKKLGKAEKKRRMAAEQASAETLFDNPEEALLFPAGPPPPFPSFQYPVESEVDRGSKFHCIRRDGRVYRPYRRVCLLTLDQFLQFAHSVAIANQ